MSQLIVDLTSPGVSVNPIISMNGAHHFNEVVFDQVFVPDDLLLGAQGQGWRQVNSELAYERSGPDRWLSTYAVFRAFLGSNAGTTSDAVTNAVGRIAARYRTLHDLSLSVARMIDEGGAPLRRRPSSKTSAPFSRSRSPKRHATWRESRPISIHRRPKRESSPTRSSRYPPSPFEVGPRRSSAVPPPRSSSDDRRNDRPDPDRHCAPHFRGAL